MASSPYAEQEGVNRQLVGNQGDSTSWYSRMIQMSTFRPMQLQ
jgi:hypothetical protein